MYISEKCSPTYFVKQKTTTPAHNRLLVYREDRDMIHGKNGVRDGYRGGERPCAGSRGIHPGGKNLMSEMLSKDEERTKVQRPVR